MVTHKYRHVHAFQPKRTLEGRQYIDHSILSLHIERASICDSQGLVVAVILRRCKVSRSGYLFPGKKATVSLIFYRARCDIMWLLLNVRRDFNNHASFYQKVIVKSMTSGTILPTGFRFDARSSTVQLRSPIRLTIARSVYPSPLDSNDGILPLAP